MKQTQQLRVAAHVTRKDLFLLSLYLIPRLRGNWIFLAVLALLIFVAVFFTRSPQTLHDTGVLALASLGAALAGVLSALLINIVSMLLKAQPDQGLLGQQQYTLSGDGVQRLTHQGEVLYRWDAIAALPRMPGYLLIKISRNQWYMVPRRAFGSGADFESFWRQAGALKAGS